MHGNIIQDKTALCCNSLPDSLEIPAVILNSMMWAEAPLICVICRKFWNMLHYLKVFFHVLKGVI